MCRSYAVSTEVSCYEKAPMLLRATSLIFIILLQLTQLQALDLASLNSKYSLLRESFSKELKQENEFAYWEGQQELHPVWDLMFYVTLLKTGHANPQIEDEVLRRVMSWQKPDGTWPLVPGGETHFDVTASIALGLERMGRGRAHPSVERTWEYLRTQRLGEKGGREINVLFRIFLTLVEILPRDAIPRFPTKIIGFPAGMPMSPMDLGIFRTMLIPLLVWDFYQDPRHRLDPIALARIQSAASQMGSLRPDSKIKSFITKPIDEVLNLFGSDWSNFVSWVGGVSSQQSDNYWAQEGLGYILSRQQSDGGWYVLGNSLVSILTLQKIIERGVSSPVDLQLALNRGVRALMKWRQLGKDEAGLPFVPAARSNIWDTSLALQNIQLEKNHENTDELQNIVRWLMNSSVAKLGDWALQSARNSQALPNPNTYVAWSFYPEAEWHPDTDDSASVLEVLLHTKFSDTESEQKRVASIQKGVFWILYMQNKDGGFPAWEKGASELSNRMMLSMLKGMPRVSDFSQADVSARILRMLVKVKKDSAFSGLVSDEVIQKTCQFLNNKKEIKSGQSLWEGDWIANYGYGTAEVVTALLEARQIVPECTSLGAAALILREFVERQNPDGGWGESTESYTQFNYVPAPSTALQTTFIAKMFLRYEALYRIENNKASEFWPVIEKAIQYLISKMNADGAIKEKSFTGVYVKGAIFSDYTLMPHYHSLGVLNELMNLPVAE